MTVQVSADSHRFDQTLITPALHGEKQQFFFKMIRNDLKSAHIMRAKSRYLFEFALKSTPQIRVIIEHQRTGV